MIAKKLKLPIDEFPKNHKVLYRGEPFSIRSAPNNLNHNRLGVVFKSGAFKKATIRNHLRRVVFDIFRTETKFFDPNLGEKKIDLLITLNPPIISLTSKEITSHINNVLNSI